MPANKKPDNTELWFKVIMEYKNKNNFELNDLIQVFNDEANKIINNKIDPEAEIVFELDEEKQLVHIYNTNMEVVDNEEEITPDEIVSKVHLADAKKIQKKAQIGDLIKFEIDITNVLNQSSKQNLLKIFTQMLKQGISSLQKKMIYNEFISKIGESVKVIFTSKNNNNNSWNVKFENDVTGYLPPHLISSKRNINPGSYHDVVIEEVSPDTKLSQITVSLDSPKIVENILKNEIPEINQGLISIKNIVRQPGERTKVSIQKTELANSLTDGFDPYGAIIGENGKRIDAISKKIDGEKIDVILYSDDIKTYITNAMQPARILDVVEKSDSTQKAFYVIVTQNGLTPAIGKRGVNATLASNLTGTSLDIISVEDAKEKGINFNESKLLELQQMTFKSYKPQRYSNRRTKPQVTFNNTNINMDVFENDVQAFEAQEKESFENKYADLDFDALFAKHKEENPDTYEEQNDKETVKQQIITDEITSNDDYKKAKEVAKNFVVDEDLKNFGLDSNFDFNDIDDEDW
ncbi:transcription termination/antitermination protein NusA [Mycoplasmopsis lipofaciens]|uniref:transcription termination/antitermination protein NusA n=1 Tax=Mycoplasmopsis lipofaciens TaxID=114884 RepID=UPI000484FA41|nr:transcription termination/antitermination protein NusA [Mycoplasmopsis lipofaciens]